jgi:zinc/manganese transport system substrate-binding protein
MPAPATVRRPARLPALLLAAVLALGLTGCATTPRTQQAASGGVIEVAASTNVWGSILRQLGGSHVRATSIITSGQVDPHAYEPTPADARTISQAKVFVANGAGYDPWAGQILTASPDEDRTVIDVGRLAGVAEGGNPHLWYSPSDVSKVVDAITAGLKKAAPEQAAYFDDRRRSFETVDLGPYHRLISEIRASHAGTAVGASESIFAPLADALGLDLVTPAGFLQAVSEGIDPSARDKATSEAQLRLRKVKAYVYNGQNATPDVAAQLATARRAGVPVVAVTETLNPPDASFQQWQVAQLQALKSALDRASG